MTDGYSGGYSDYAQTMGGLIDTLPNPYTQHLFGNDCATARSARNFLIWQIASGTWVEWLRKPSGMRQELWDALTPRFTVTNVQTPVIMTIISASYGGGVTRRVRKAYNQEALQAIANSNWYGDLVKRGVTKAGMYGTGFVVPGFRRGKPNGIELSPLATEVLTAEDDVDDVRAVSTTYARKKRTYRESGISETSGWLGRERMIPDTNCGFIPVCRFYGRRMDSSSPYGESLVWPATQETVQITYLSNDLMVLERMQSFSTLVIQGNEAGSPKEKQAGPFNAIRLAAAGDEGNAKAYYISPNAAIDKVNDLIESKFERTATQCQVPVEIFTRARSGTNQGTGAALLTHKPLYDLVVELQNQGRDSEHELLAMYDALLTWDRTGVPQDLDKVRDNLDVEIVFERESNPAITQSEAQTYQLLLDEGLVSFRKSYLHFNPDADDAEVAEAEKRRNEMRTLAMAQTFPGGDTTDDSDDSADSATVTRGL